MFDIAILFAYILCCWHHNDIFALLYFNQGFQLNVGYRIVEQHIIQWPVACIA